MRKDVEKESVGIDHPTLMQDCLYRLRRCSSTCKYLINIYTFSDVCQIHVEECWSQLLSPLLTDVALTMSEESIYINLNCELFSMCHLWRWGKVTYLDDFEDVGDFQFYFFLLQHRREHKHREKRKGKRRLRERRELVVHIARLCRCHLCRRHHLQFIRVLSSKHSYCF